MRETKQQTIEELRERYRKLNEQKIRASANLKTATDQLEQLNAEAKKQWGTSDLAELEKKLAEMREENDRRRADYQKHLETVERALAEVDEKYAVS